MGEYQQSITVLQNNQEIWNVSSTVTNCLDWNCYEGRLHNDSVTLIAQGKESTAYLCDPANDFLGLARRLIVLYKPGARKVFETKLAVIRLALHTIQRTGKTPALERDVTDNIAQLEADIRGIQDSFKRTRHQADSDQALAACQTLSGYASRLLGYRSRCILSRCGIMGHGNPAVGVMNGAVRLSDGCALLIPALSCVASFCRQIHTGLDNAENTLVQLKNSHPADHADKALEQIDQLAGIWHGLTEAIKNE